MSLLLKVNEVFYSIQGEGLWAGAPCIFVRLAGCNLKCPFCDTDYSQKFEATSKDLLDIVINLRAPTRRIVITGGEPCMQNLYPFIEYCHNYGLSVHLETNGTLPVPTTADWVTYSPKSTKGKPIKAQEVKFLCGMEDWEEVIGWVISTPGLTFKWMGLQPISQDWEHVAYNYCLRYPWLFYSCQIHKKINVK